jgi:hypothetical protein
LQFRLGQNNLDALADADLKRIQYARGHYFSKDDSEGLYFEALLRMKKEYVKCPMGAMISYHLADHYFQKATDKNSGSQFTMNEALKICNETIKNYPQSDGAKNCETLKLSIFKQELSISTDKNLVPGETAKALVQFRNINKIYLKWVWIDYKTKDKIFEIKNKETEAPENLVPGSA